MHFLLSQRLQSVTSVSSSPELLSDFRSAVASILGVSSSRISIKSISSFQGDGFFGVDVAYDVSVVNGNSDVLISTLNTAISSGAFTGLLVSAGYTSAVAESIPQY